MRTKLVFLISILILFAACKSNNSQISYEDKREQIKLIKNKFQLTNNEFQKIKKEDSIIIAVVKSLKKDIKFSLIERRLDSFFVDNYTKKQLLTILKLDYNFPNLKKPFELNKSKDADGIEIRDLSEMKRLMNQTIKRKVEIDTISEIKKKDSI